MIPFNASQLHCLWGEVKYTNSEKMEEKVYPEEKKWGIVKEGGINHQT